MAATAGSGNLVLWTERSPASSLPCMADHLSLSLFISFLIIALLLSPSPSLLSSSFLRSPPPRPPSEIVVVARSGGGNGGGHVTAAVCERPPPLNGFSHGVERPAKGERGRDQRTDERASQRHTNILLCAVELKPHTVRDAYREIGLGAHPTSTS